MRLSGTDVRHVARSNSKTSRRMYRRKSTCRPRLELLEQRQLLSTYYVATTGSDGNNGSAGSPFATLQHAANLVVAGDTVDVSSGTYAGFSMDWEVTQTGTASAPITWNASPGVVIDASNPDTADGIDLEGASYVTINGFTVDNTTGSITRAGIRAVNDTNVLIENNTVENCAQWEIFSGFANNLHIIDNVASGATVQHGIYVSNTSSNPEVIGNTVFGNQDCGIQLNGDASDGGVGIITGAVVEDNTVYNNGAGGGSAINCDGVQNSVIANNLLYGNQAGGIALFQIDGGGPSINNVVADNTIVSPSSARYDVNIQDVSGISVYNNIFYNSNSAAGSIEVPSGSLTGFASDYNVVVNALTNNGGTSNETLSQWQSSTGQDLHSKVATPSQLFVNATANNYQELSTSPSIGAGTSTDAPSTDLLGNARPSAKGYDIGAYEYESTFSLTAESPAHSAASVAVSSTVTATFNQPVKAGTVSFTLKNSAGKTVADSVTYNSATDTFTLAPTSALAYGTTYTATVSGAQSTSGVAMSAPVSWSFSTDPLQLTVSSHGPTSGKTGVAVATVVNATFNEAVQSSTINFTVQNSAGTAVAGKVSYNSTTNVATFVPSASLAYGTTYTATVSGAKDTAGDPMGGSTSWSFTTDSLQPAVSSHTPASGATGVAVSTAPSATFNEAVQSSAITLATSAGTAVAGSASYNATTKTETFTPTAALAYGTTYTATVSGAKDSASDPMSGSVSWSFTTAVAAPAVVAGAPASGATGVVVSSTPSATFNEAVQATTIIFTIQNSAGTAVAGKVSYNTTTNVATFVPSASLAYGTKYTATVSGAKSSSGASMSSPFTWSFTTDALQPALSSHTPASGATGVAVSSAPSATFNEAVQSSTITFNLTTGSGTAVAGSAVYNSSTNIVIFTPTAALAYGTTYTATVSGAKDTAGDPMSGSTSWSFTTDSLQPALSSDMPASGATGVAVSSTPSATFNEAVQSSTIAFTLTNSSGAAVAGSAAYNSATNEVIFTPTATLAYGTTYTATVSGAKDTAGDPMSGSTTWSFTTDALQPAVSSHTPASSATGVAVGSTPIATFNEAVQSGTITFTLATSAGTALTGTASYNATINSETFTPNGGGVGVRHVVHRDGERRQRRGRRSDERIVILVVHYRRQLVPDGQCRK